MNARRPPTRAHHSARIAARRARLRHRSAAPPPGVHTHISWALGLRATDDTESFDAAAALAAVCAPLCGERELLERILGHTPLNAPPPAAHRRGSDAVRLRTATGDRPRAAAMLPARWHACPTAVLRSVSFAH